MDKLFLLDAYALIYRSYYAFMKAPRINSKGLNTSCVMGVLQYPQRDTYQGETYPYSGSFRPWRDLPS